MAGKNNHTNLFAIVTILYWFSMYSYVPIFSPYIESLGASYKMVGIVLGSYGFTQMIIRIPLGIFSDHLNRRKIFVISGVFLGLLSSGGLWLFDNIYLILLFRSLAGTAAATWVSFTVLFSRYYKEDETAKSIGIINSFTKIGQVLAMFAGGIVAQRFGQQSTFLLGALGGLLGLILSVGIKEKKDIIHEASKISELLQVAKNQELLTSSFLAVIFQLVVYATTFGFIPVIAKNIGASSVHLGLITTITTLPAIISSSLSGTFFARRYGERNTIVGGFIIIALSCIVVPFIDRLSLLYTSQVINGFGQGIVLPILMGLSIKNVTGSKRGTAMGLFQAIYGLGMFLGPVLLGYLGDTVGMNTGFYLIGLISFLGAFLTLVSCKSRGIQITN